MGDSYERADNSDLYNPQRRRQENNFDQVEDFKSTYYSNKENFLYFSNNFFKIINNLGHPGEIDSENKQFSRKNRYIKRLQKNGKFRIFLKNNNSLKYRRLRI